MPAHHSRMLLLLVIVLAGALLVWPLGAAAVRPAAVGGGASMPLGVSVAVTPGQAVVTITGGRPTFEVRSLQANSATFEYSGPARAVTVPIDNGIVIFQVTDGAGVVVTSTPVAAGVEMWVAEPAYGRISKYSSDLATTTARSTSVFTGLRNIAVRPSDSHLFAVDQSAGQVVELNPDGAEARRFAVPGGYRPQDVSFDAAGHIFVVDRTAPAGKVYRFDSAGSLEASAAVMMPIGVPLPQYGNTTMHIVYHAPSDALLIRFNSGAIVGVDPSTLATRWYRYSSDPLLLPGWDMDPTAEILYSGVYSGGWGKQSAFINGPNHLAPLVGTGFAPFDWTVSALQPMVTDVSVDEDGFIYVLQADSGGTMGMPVRGARVYVYDGAGTLLMDWEVPGALRLGVIR